MVDPLGLCGENAGGFSLSAIAGGVKTFSNLSQKALMLKLNSIFGNNLISQSEAKNIVDRILGLGNDLKYSLTTTTGKYGLEMGSISKAKYASTLNKLATGFKVAGNAVRLAIPIIEEPNSTKQYQYIADEGSPILATIGATGDAVSFGSARSTLKIVELLKYTPFMSDETAKNIDSWINNNINGASIARRLQ